MGKRQDNSRPLADSEERAVDVKGRFMIPAQWRVRIGKDLYISPNTSDGLLVTTEDEFKALKDKVRQLEDAPQEQRARSLRYLEYNTERSQVDAQGRVMLNERQLNRGHIRPGETVVLTLRELGFEVCNKQRFDQVQAMDKPSWDSLGRQLGV